MLEAPYSRFAGDSAVAVKIAPEQGWGIHWNEAHPNQPFTPVEVGPPPYISAAPPGSTQATPVISVPASSPQAVVPAVIEHASAPIAASSGIGAAAQSVPVLQAVSPPGVVTDLLVPAGLQGGGAQPGAAIAPMASDASDGSIAPLTLASHWAGDGWFIVPSAANEYGQAYAAGDGGFEFDVASGSFASDWFWV